MIPINQLHCYICGLIFLAMDNKLVIFDLDFTLWNCGGTYCDHTQPPYIQREGKIFDMSHAEMKLYPDVIHILEELYHSRIKIAIASRTHAASWAEDLMDKFNMSHYFKVVEMFPSSKIPHFQRIQQKTGIAFENMYFFDDEQRNIDEVRTLGVNCFLVNDGIKYDDVMAGISAGQIA